MCQSLMIFGVNDDMLLLRKTRDDDLLSEIKSWLYTCRGFLPTQLSKICPSAAEIRFVITHQRVFFGKNPEVGTMNNGQSSQCGFMELLDHWIHLGIMEGHPTHLWKKKVLIGKAKNQIANVVSVF